MNFPSYLAVAGAGTPTATSSPHPSAEAIAAFKAVVDYSGTLVSWALAWAGGSVIAFISTSYDKPKSRSGRLIYLPFLGAWVSLSISVYQGQLIFRRYLATLMVSPDQSTFDTILGKVNGEFDIQLTFLQYGLVCLAVWLLFFTIYFFLSAPGKKENAQAGPSKPAEDVNTKSKGAISEGDRRSPITSPPMTIASDLTGNTAGDTPLAVPEPGPTKTEDKKQV